MNDNIFTTIENIYHKKLPRKIYDIYHIVTCTTSILLIQGNSQDFIGVQYITFEIIFTPYFL